MFNKQTPACMVYSAVVCKMLKLKYFLKRNELIVAKKMAIMIKVKTILYSKKKATQGRWDLELLN